MEEAKLKKIKGIAFDIDGVMTDGGIFCMSDGDLLRIFDAKDSFAVRMAAMHGFHTAVITGGRSISIVKRCTGMGVPEDDVHLASRIKSKDLQKFCDKYGMDPSEVMYFGDDLPDIPVIKAVGLGVAPSDAVEEVRQAADFVSPYPGGKGCVRHAIEMVLRAQGQWTFDEALYEKQF